MIDRVLDLLWSHDLDMFHRFNDIGAKNLSVTGQTLLQDERPHSG